MAKLQANQLKGLKVFVYFNLHKGTWSLKALEGPQKGKVVFHAEQVGLMDCMPKVPQKGRESVIREQKKNVHKGFVGQVLWVDGAEVDTTGKREITHSPYKKSHFVYKETLDEYKGSSYAVLKGKTIWEIV